MLFPSLLGRNNPHSPHHSPRHTLANIDAQPLCSNLQDFEGVGAGNIPEITHLIDMIRGLASPPTRETLARVMTGVRFGIKHDLHTAMAPFGKFYFHVLVELYVEWNTPPSISIQGLT
jgi:hypothetical protein